MNWTFRNTCGKDRRDELVELYESLEFEVRVEKYSSDSSADVQKSSADSCEFKDGCMSGGEYYKIYTRKIQQ